MCDFKFQLGQRVYYLADGLVGSADVTSRMRVEHSHENWASTDQQVSIFRPWDKSGTWYMISGGTKVRENELYPSRQELAQAIIDGDI